MFRVSPWINYKPSDQDQALIPSTTTTTDNMDDDVDMDAPEISTLREENTPPPTRTSKFRVKLVVKDSKKSASTTSNKSSRKPPAAPVGGPSEDEDAEDEDEEDQLIDDDDDDDVQPSASISAGAPAVPAKRKVAAKKAKPRATKTERTEPPEKKAKQEPAAADEGDNWDAQSGSVVISEPPQKAATKKKAAPKKAATQKPKAKASKAGKAIPLPPADDVAAMSETYTGTAPSSPIPHDKGSPEPEVTVQNNPAGPSNEDQNLESVPLPVYPLPSKPFPVQPPPKIPSGFAPVVPLDRSGNKVRHWRTANREIRGIAGGRWLTRSWVGDKESEFALAAASTIVLKGSLDSDKASTSTSKMAAMSISAPIPGKGGKSKGAKGQATASVGPSRAGSSNPDALPTTGSASVRAPTKMRTIVAGPASEIDVDSDAAAVGT